MILAIRVDCWEPTNIRNKARRTRGIVRPDLQDIYLSWLDFTHYFQTPGPIIRASVRSSRMLRLSTRWRPSSGSGSFAELASSWSQTFSGRSSSNDHQLCRHCVRQSSRAMHVSSIRSEKLGFSMTDFPPSRIRNLAIIAHVRLQRSKSSATYEGEMLTTACSVFCAPELSGRPWQIYIGGPIARIDKYNTQREARREQ